MEHARKRPGAFTLVELLVVIAIIATLAAILFPIFAQAREKSRQSVCLSHQKQINLAVWMYMQDYDERFPLTFFAEGASDGTFLNWRKAVTGYVKHGKLFTCPSLPNVVYATGMNFYLATIQGVPLATVLWPSRQILIADSRKGCSACDWAVDRVGPRNCLVGATNDSRFQADPRHHHGVQAVFVDNHAKRLTNSRGVNARADLHEGPPVPCFTGMEGDHAIGTFFYPTENSP